MKFCCAFLIALTVCFLLIPPALTQTAPSPVAGFERKLQHLQSNAAQASPDPSPTAFTEQEINAYLASGQVELPTGVRSVVLQEQPGIIVGTSRVDFDQLKAGRNSYNPLLSVFSGVHEVVVVAHAHGSGRTGYVHVDSVALDGVKVPDFVLELFVDKFLTPKYPQIGIDSQFALPDRIDTATVGLHQLAVTQK